MREEDLIDEDIYALDSFTCSMFVYSKVIFINETSYLHFKSKCKLRAAKPLDFLKNIDLRLFPHVNRC